MSTTLLPEYEKNCLNEYVNGNEKALVFSNSNEVNVETKNLLDQN